MKDDEIRKTVRERYAEIAVEGKSASNASCVSGCTPQETDSVTSC
ncbi:hypothetical protein ACFLUR_03655 [Chloroflexota bacterium]